MIIFWLLLFCLEFGHSCLVRHIIQLNLCQSRIERRRRKKFLIWNNQTQLEL
ncbi:uncharacterized protein DS421_1g16240 [Arachis hypogaea]|nr:uncharacterized protein DS421_1g16240 [Arachis hypogaea]